MKYVSYDFCGVSLTMTHYCTMGGFENANLSGHFHVFSFLSYQETHRTIDGVDALHWKEPKLLCKILLHYFRHHPNDISLLFQLLRATTARYLPDFQVPVLNWISSQSFWVYCSLCIILSVLFSLVVPSRLSGKYCGSKLHCRLEATSIL